MKQLIVKLYMKNCCHFIICHVINIIYVNIDVILFHSFFSFIFSILNPLLARERENWKLFRGIQV